MRIITTLAMLSCLMLLGVGPAFGELVSNGDFSSGTADFTTSYSIVSQNTNAEEIGVIDNPTTGGTPWNTAFTNFNAHGGSGLMLMVNGSTNAIASPLVWGQAISVESGKTYNVSFWAANASSQSEVSGQSANLALTFDFVNPISLDLSGKSAGTWTQASGTYTATTTGSVIMRIYNNTFTSAGNDFAIDDISVTVVPEPSSLVLLGIGSLVGLGVYTRRRRKSA